MSDTMLKYQCPACGAPLSFSAEKQLLKCESCESEFSKDLFAEHANPNAQATAEGTQQTSTDKIDWSTASVSQNHENAANQPGFNCTSCGAEVISDGVTVATECMYCGNPVVMTNNISGMATPDLVIPFRIEKSRAEAILKEFYKGKPLLPNAFSSANRIKKISGVYVPFWLFSCTGGGNMTFNATKVNRWSDSNYNYVHTKYYEVSRSGQLGFNKIPVDASTKMSDDYMDGIEPFNYQDLVPFSPMYMAGYFADKFDVSVDDCSHRANERVINSTESAFASTVQGYSTVTKQFSNIQMHGDNIDYALLPVWMLNTKYEDKMYQFAINGQTGQVSGELPIDKMKLLKYRIGITLAAMIPATLIALYFVA